MYKSYSKFPSCDVLGFGIGMPLPFVSRREILLTNNDLRVRFDDCEGIMTVDDIESVEQTKRPRHLSVIAKEHLRLHGCSGVQVFLSAELP